MVKVYQTSAKTDTGDTVKTLIDTLTVPQNVSKLVGIGVQTGGPGGTTLEDISGILSLESDTMEWKAQSIPLTSVHLTGTGMAAAAVQMWPCDITVVPGGTIKGSVTLDMANTINPTARFVLAYA